MGRSEAAARVFMASVVKTRILEGKQMKLRTILAATAVGAVAAPAAWAQTPPIEGGTEVGGDVSSFSS